MQQTVLFPAKKFTLLPKLYEMLTFVYNVCDITDDMMTGIVRLCLSALLKMVSQEMPPIRW